MNISDVSLNRLETEEAMTDTIEGIYKEYSEINRKLTSLNKKLDGLMQGQNDIRDRLVNLALIHSK